jgi:inosine-uridine nucleoside N-ribohydrolase
MHLTGCPCIKVVGLDVTHHVEMTGQQLAELEGQGRFGSFLHKISKFYLQYHR